MILYCKLIKIPLGAWRTGIARLKMINASPEQMKTVTRGDTIEVAITPTGQKLPKTFRDTGAVINWAPVEADREFARAFGINFEQRQRKKFDVRRMPARAPQDIIKPIL